MSFEEYNHCRVCGKFLTKGLREYGYERFQRMTCSTECSTTESIRNHGCCDKAMLHPCVCHISFKCPDHGITHIGTHD